MTEAAEARGTERERGRQRRPRFVVCLACQAKPASRRFPFPGHQRTDPRGGQGRQLHQAPQSPHDLVSAKPQSGREEGTPMAPDPRTIATCPRRCAPLPMQVAGHPTCTSFDGYPPKTATIGTSKTDAVSSMWHSYQIRRQVNLTKGTLRVVIVFAMVLAVSLALAVPHAMALRGNDYLHTSAHSASAELVDEHAAHLGHQADCACAFGCGPLNSDCCMMALCHPGLAPDHSASSRRAPDGVGTAAPPSSTIGRDVEVDVPPPRILPV